MAVKEAVVRARVDKKLKHDSETILRRLGISQTEAIRMCCGRGCLSLFRCQVRTTMICFSRAPSGKRR
jgi:hypothetical protein